MVCVVWLCVWSEPSGHCLHATSGPSSLPWCEQQLISSDQSCPHSQPPPSPERKINCSHAVNRNKKIHCDKVAQPLQIPHEKWVVGGRWWVWCRAGVWDAAHKEQLRCCLPSAMKPMDICCVCAPRPAFCTHIQLLTTPFPSAGGNYSERALAPGEEHPSVALCDCRRRKIITLPEEVKHSNLHRWSNKAGHDLFSVKWKAKKDCSFCDANKTQSSTTTAWSVKNSFCHRFRGISQHRRALLLSAYWTVVK